MSPASIRRYRAERLLRDDFKRLRARVLAAVSARLAASGVALDASDLDACYAQAWQGLYTVVLAGQQIANPGGWLVLVTQRRALEEHRAGRRIAHGCGWPADESPALPGEAPGTVGEGDLAEGLEDRMRLRQLFEGLSARLTAREREAAALCYLQGLSRAQAAAVMGLSEQRMRRLMEGRAPGRPGVAGKMGALVETIRAGRWCEEQSSLMRALAYGILDPEGERHRVAVAHRGECPACRAYILSLRGLAAVLPPSPWPLGLGAGVLARAGLHTHVGAAAAAAKGAGAGGAVSAGAGAQVGPGVGGVLSLPGAAGAAGAAGAGGAAGGGWLLAGGPIGAKLAVGCLLALGIGAGCIEIGGGGHRAPRVVAAARPGAGAHARLAAGDALPSRPPGDAVAVVGSLTRGATPARGAEFPSAAAPGGREFTLEHPSAGAPAGLAARPAPALQPARSAQSAARAPVEAVPLQRVGPANANAGAGAPEGAATGPAARGVLAAEHEFSPG
jgi:DNA-directed RNA polymerase specialized sigma24 family protein